MKQFDLDDRLEDFAASIIRFYSNNPKTFAADYLAKQLIRSSCSAALNFGEFLGAASDKDKANKLRIVLKELRESIRNINIQTKALIYKKEDLESLNKENDELIRIIVTILKRY
ncbi:four helix bundle protein [Subsaximicrobium wynnwilliamsii]|jgi:four helix bundle protein|uniref:Four helix bundle protein n=1 Tax=Subsaximicrobium wynnwilliamsii TaxID=291179 RepID=A0A5C6ZP00_9FLAO|nr:four helix bundle protein [Subsaximicrobium wynnwilliamsii]TXD85393.1 four helix bundle protein [Subsaximicrobium wynnwilliamsii]TXD90746.1 four helix bundle protein [Subsaximicrobium wynnwilliamsii]TXE05253.1 four helix bundle protein [Subsaximicrobium wynnwilliamsii]